METKATPPTTTATGDPGGSTRPEARARAQVETLAYRILISVIFIILILLHLTFPGLQIDAITVAMAIVAMLPWFGRLIENLEAPGGWKIRFREFRVEVKKDIKNISNELSYLKFLFANFLTPHEIQHLRNLTNDRFHFNKSESFDQELRRLRALGFLEPIGPDKGIRSMNADPSRDVKNHFRITERGRTYLQLLDDMERNLAREQSYDVGSP
jgi:hypothetical protein